MKARAVSMRLHAQSSFFCGRVGDEVAGTGGRSRMGPQVARRTSPAAARRPVVRSSTTLREFRPGPFRFSIHRGRRRSPLLLSERLPPFDEIAHLGASRMRRLPHLKSSLIRQPKSRTSSPSPACSGLRSGHTGVAYAACVVVISWYKQRTQRLATAAAITLPGFPARRS